MTAAPNSALTGFARFFTGNFRHLWHIVFWTLYSADELLSLVGVTEIVAYGFDGYLIALALVMAVAYFNLGILVPRYLQLGRFGAYSLFAGLVVALFPILFIFVEELLLTHFLCGECEPIYLESFQDYLSYYLYQLMETVFVLGTTTSLKLFKDLVLAQKRIQTLENKKLQAELDFLKAQINPHFLFNSINNIYVLTRVDPKKASETILHFSDLLSYQLYDCAGDEVLLSKEIDYLNNFMELHRIRKENARINFNIEGDPSGISIPPFLFIPFLENALKHGNSIREDGYIEVEMKVSPERIDYKVVNSKGEPLPETESSGLGLENARRRLNLLFPGKHKLEIKDMKDSFSIHLNIELK